MSEFGKCPHCGSTLVHTYMGSETTAVGEDYGVLWCMYCGIPCYKVFPKWPEALSTPIKEEDQPCQ